MDQKASHLSTNTHLGIIPTYVSAFALGYQIMWYGDEPTGSASPKGTATTAYHTNLSTVPTRV